MSKIIKKKVIREIDELRNINNSRYITDRVAKKAKNILSLINDKYFEYIDYSYATTWHTYCIDFSKDKNLFSLEVGYKKLGYFTELNDNLHKQIDFIDIETEEKIKEAILEIETDLEILF